MVHTHNRLHRHGMGPGRRPRVGRPDGASVQGVYIARWVDEDRGPRTAEMRADSSQAVRDALEPLVGQPVDVRQVR